MREEAVCNQAPRRQKLKQMGHHNITSTLKTDGTVTAPKSSLITKVRDAFDQYMNAKTLSRNPSMPEHRHTPLKYKTEHITNAYIIKHSLQSSFTKILFHVFFGRDRAETERQKKSAMQTCVAIHDLRSIRQKHRNDPKQHHPIICTRQRYNADYMSKYIILPPVSFMKQNFGRTEKNNTAFANYRQNEKRHSMIGSYEPVFHSTDFEPAIKSAYSDDNTSLKDVRTNTKRQDF